MKRFTGTIQTTAAIPVAQSITVPVVPTVETQSLLTLLPTLKKSDGSPLVTPNEALSLVGIKFKSGEAVLSLTDRYFVYEVVNMLDSLDFEVVFNFLNTDWEKVFGFVPDLRKKILFENPLLKAAKEKVALDMEIFRNRIDVAKGAVNCKRCGSEETLSVERQTRAADEPMTIRVFCTSCKYRWTAQ